MVSSEYNKVKNINSFYKLKVHLYFRYWWLFNDNNKVRLLELSYTFKNYLIYLYNVTIHTKMAKEENNFTGLFIRKTGCVP